MEEEERKETYRNDKEMNANNPDWSVYIIDIYIEASHCTS